MAGFGNALSSWSIHYWPLILDHLWQATIFSALAFLAVLTLHRAPARTRYAVWLIALAKFVLPASAILAAWSWAGYDLPAFWNDLLWFVHFGSDWGIKSASGGLLYPLLSALWAAGSIFLLCRWLYRYHLFANAVRASDPIEAGREVRALRRARGLLNMHREVSIRLSDTIGEPGVWGVRHSVIVLPKKMVGHFSQKELEAVILHEMAHVTRHDNLIGNISMVLCCLFWFHPLVWWIDSKLLAERERACDDRVLQLVKPSRVYAAGLIKVVRFRLDWGLPGIAGASGSHIGNRIERILKGRPGHSVSFWHRAVLGTLAIGLLVAMFSDGRPSDTRRCEAKCRAQQGSTTTAAGSLGRETLMP